ncbi:hypothetical protein M8J76_003344 [Diaphorina citri]|nr:hypothetical protein M8J75_015764 [Diaphorina citri]KAI5732718.1 hypothetical protein M8J76_003344 [Diaphorina citri]
MSLEGGEREARNIDIETAYVHQAYQQISGLADFESDQADRAWPKVRTFLEALEPGSLVCDVGCGNGKYLTMNPSVFKIGVDRCCKLTELAREKNNEILLCDNLNLPFRDESFDAVLSIAVIHHFTTTERRVVALQELTRVLRIGGRIIISVWAMEQKNRKFKSQDVLVPWHRPKNLSIPSLDTTTTSEEENSQYNSDKETSSCIRKEKNKENRRSSETNKKRRKSFHPFPSSPSSSSLSSPNESCYSFVRKALQKLAGSKKVNRHRPWFLESWNSITRPPRRYDPDGCEDNQENIQDIPIELRRLEDEPKPLAITKRQTFATTHQRSDVTIKSKSLTDIPQIEVTPIVRSRSSVPALEFSIESKESVTSSLKPKLVKQKQNIDNDDEDVEAEEEGDMRDLVKALPDFKVSALGTRNRGNVFKQSSMNEELMSTERLREKERVRQNIQKQASLNEELIYRRNRTLDSLRDTLFSANTAKRFQLLKTGLTEKLKNSTTNIEKVAGASFKNGFVRMLQGWKSADMSAPIPQPPPPSQNNQHSSFAQSTSLVKIRAQSVDGERRKSREDGSDSSKDSSLQSDTSVDSEDSFASVIFIPKADPLSSTTSPTLQSAPASPQPTSPKMKFPPPTSPKFKQPLMSPKYKQPLLQGTSAPASPINKHFVPTSSSRPFLNSPVYKCRTSLPETDLLPMSDLKIPLPKSAITGSTEPRVDICEGTESLKNKVIETEKQSTPIEEKPKVTAGLSTAKDISTKLSFPLIKRLVSSEPMPKLMNIELFNPEIDDVDSDSSGVSSPDSIGSVISVVNEDTLAQVPPPAPTEAATSAASSASPVCLPVSPNRQLLEAAAGVASSLEEAVEVVIKHVTPVPPPLPPPPLILLDDADNKRKHLIDFAEKLSDKLLSEMDKTKEEEKPQPEEPAELHRMDPFSYFDEDFTSPRSEVTVVRNEEEWSTDLMKVKKDNIKEQSDTESDSSWADSRRNTILSHKIELLAGSDVDRRPSISVETIEPTLSLESGDASSSDESRRGDQSLKPGLSLESDAGDGSDRTFSGSDVSRAGDSRRDTISTVTSGSQISLLRPGTSLESNDTNSSDSSRKVAKTPSTASFTSDSRWSDCSKDTRFADRRMARCDGRSSSEESSRRPPMLVRQRASVQEPPEVLTTAESVETSLSGSTSQESSLSETGGSITYHRYYHVFREGELDQLIERYVENLHVISSYYDHANWCVVAEKVHVWTI